MDWQSLKLFLVAGRHGSLSAAAHEVGISIPTLSRHLSAFEAKLGLRLLVRTPRGISLTDQGVALLRKANPSLEQMAEIERFAGRMGSSRQEISIRISATEPIIADVLAPSMALLPSELRSGHIVLHVENRVVSLALNDADIAVRLARPEGDSLMAKRVAVLRMGLFATQMHARAVATGGMNALAAQPFLTYDDTYGPIPELRWIDSLGLRERVVLRTSSTRGQFSAAIAGAGFAILPAIIAEKDKCLVEVEHPALPAIPERPIWAVWHRDRNRDRKLKAAVAWIVDCFRLAAQPNVPSAGNVSSNQ